MFIEHPAVIAAATVVNELYTEAQLRLAKRHGTPAEFAQACYAACPAFVSMDEARAAVEKYTAEFMAARQE